MKPAAFLSASTLLELNLTGTGSAGSVLWTAQPDRAGPAAHLDRTDAAIFKQATGCRSP